MRAKVLKNKIVIYQAKNGAIELRGDIKKETIWANQAQIAELFTIDQSVVSRHIRNVFKDREIKEESNMQKMHNANSDKPIVFYSLDVVLSVGYRTNSKVAIEFRQWATETLHQHIVKGYTLNPKVIKHNYAEFHNAVQNIKQLLPVNASINNESILELISAFAETWLSLDAYDKNKLSSEGSTKKIVELTVEQLTKALVDFRTSLIKKGEATELFGSDRNKDSVAGIVGNVMQSFGGRELYSSIEEKAAHLLYFMVKNHPFIDGNKRNGAYAFIWFLQRAGLLNMTRINPSVLTVLTLFIAESDPTNKNKMIKLVLQLLKK